MPIATRSVTKVLFVILLAMAASLIGPSGYIYAADRTVVGELWSADG